MLNWKGRARKQPWPNLRYSPTLAWKDFGEDETPPAPNGATTRCLAQPDNRVSLHHYAVSPPAEGLTCQLLIF
jgi:hypothetical protein